MVQVFWFLMHLLDKDKQVNTIKNYHATIMAIHWGFGQVHGGLKHGPYPAAPGVGELQACHSLPVNQWGAASSRSDPIQANAFLPLGALDPQDFVPSGGWHWRNGEVAPRTCPSIPAILDCRTMGFAWFPILRFWQSPRHLRQGPSYYRRFPQHPPTTRIRNWCPVRALKGYLHWTKEIHSYDNLFILPSCPYSSGSRDIILCCLTKIISPNAQGQIRAHKVWGQVRMKVVFSRLPIEDILKAAVWKTPTMFVACYLTDIISAKVAFGCAILDTSRSPNAQVCEVSMLSAYSQTRKFRRNRGYLLLCEMKASVILASFVIRGYCLWEIHGMI